MFPPAAAQGWQAKSHRSKRKQTDGQPKEKRKKKKPSQAERRGVDTNTNALGKLQRGEEQWRTHEGGAWGVGRE
jgi:hypothetical protein